MIAIEELLRTRIFSQELHAFCMEVMRRCEVREESA